jgi:dipeptidyl aminopeptidase/acylaminoacyl peptidase
MYVVVLLLSLSSLVLPQAKDLLPAENLVTDGVPPVPATIVEGVGRYTEFRSASLASWNPLKKEMLIITRFGDTPQIHYVKSPGGARTQLTFFTDRIGGAAFGPKRDDYILFMKDIGGGEWFQIFRYDRGTGAITMLTDGKSRNLMGAWSENGEKFTYMSTRRNGRDLDLYVMDPLRPESDSLTLELSGGGWSAIDWSPDGRTILLMEGLSANESYLWSYNLVTRQKVMLTPKEDTVQVSRSGAVFSKDGKGLYLTSDQNSEFLRLWYMDIKTRTMKLLSAGLNWDVESFALSPDGKRIAFVTNEDGFGVLHLLDTKTQKELAVPKLPKGLISGLEWHENGSLLGCNINSARASNDVYSIDVKSGKVERWTESETGGLNVTTFSEPELVRWKSFDGTMISGLLYMPPARFTGKRPLIINIHGGPEGQARPGFLGRANYYLNELGAAMLFPNIRGSSGYGKTFLKLDNGFLRQDSYKDIGALLDWAATRGDLDAGKIMVTGGSYGGHMTFAIAGIYPDRIRCSVPVVGISNLVTFLERTEAYRRDLRRVEYGDERDPKMREFLTSIAPMNNAQKITKPMFVIQGKNDPRVPYTESEQMVSTLKKNSVPVWYLLANDEGHGFAKKKNQDYQMYATVLFVKEFLLK